MRLRQAGRSEKAKSRKSDMHAAEESDRGVVPVKQPNKEAFASAEVVEGSLRTKENQVQSHTSPTQSGAGVFPGVGSGAPSGAGKETGAVHQLCSTM